MATRQDAGVRRQREQPVATTPVPPGGATRSDAGDRADRPNGVPAAPAGEPWMTQLLHNLMVTLGAWTV